MVKDGLDLAPNPPSVFVEKINPLPEGTYNFIIEVEHYFSDDLMTETKVVSVGPAFHAIPSGSPTSLIVLIALLGVLAVMNHITKR